MTFDAAAAPAPATSHTRHRLDPLLHAGTIRKAQQVSLCSSLEPGKVRFGKVNELFVYDNFSRTPVEEVQAGDICALTGIQDISVGGAGLVWDRVGWVAGGTGWLPARWAAFWSHCRSAVPKCF